MFTIILAGLDAYSAESFTLLYVGAFIIDLAMWQTIYSFSNKGKGE